MFPNKNIEKPIVLIDAYNLFMRHFIANPTISLLGESAGGIVGFLKNLQWITESTLPKKILVIWEGGGSTKKRAIYKDYKAKRRPEKLNRFYGDDIPDTIENRNWQVQTLVFIMKNLPINQIYVENCEADDVIGYLCKYKFQNENKVIVSSDKDFYQLIDEKTIIYSPTSKDFVDEEVVLNRFGISPRNFCLAKAVSGDTSDNVPGIKGAGFKVLSKRYPEFSSTNEDFLLTDFFKKTQDLKSEKKIKLFDTILENKDVIERNWKLMYLDTNVLSYDQISKIDYRVDNFVPKHDMIGLIKSLKQSGLSTFDGTRLFMSLNYIK